MNGLGNSFAQASDIWWAHETGMPTDSYAYRTSAVSAMSDRPARLQEAPMSNGYLNKYESFIQKASKDISS